MTDLILLQINTLSKNFYFIAFHLSSKATIMFCQNCFCSGLVIDSLYAVHLGWTVQLCCDSISADCKLVRDGVWCRKRAATSHPGPPISGPSESCPVLSATARVLSNSGELQQGRLKQQ